MSRDPRSRTMAVMALLAVMALAGVAIADTTASPAPAGKDSAVAAAPDSFFFYDEPPRAIKIFAPVNPTEAMRMRMEGTVDVRMTVSERGRVIAAEVYRSDTIPLLEEAALNAARISLFRPALAGGKPVKARLVFSFPFKAR